MIKIGIIKEEKIPADNRVALTPDQCRWLLSHNKELEIEVQPSAIRCFPDVEYERAGARLTEDLSGCSILLGIKEAAISSLIDHKTYLFFSHTRKKQPQNQALLKSILEKNITLIDYECLEHDDGQRIIGFGFFAGIVGAHNGIMAYGKRTGLYHLERVFKQKNFKELIHSYFGLKLPNIKVVITGSGRVAHGLIEVMNLLGLHEVEPDEYLRRRFAYPVYTQLKGKDLYEHEITGNYSREDFHQHPQNYQSKFYPYACQTDILLNGVYWEENIPRLFHPGDINHPDFIIQTIADVSDDKEGSVPVNIGSGTIEDPVYGIDRATLIKTSPYEMGSIDIMAVGNLPNELPRDASRYFGEQLIKYVLSDLLQGGSKIIQRATIASNGQLGDHYAYLQDYVER
ncbi:NAD(P)-dependent oxidoreductase [Niabella hibiscisoli]|uniref:NAD(P)-dependent oxidoreductase n=1 Tax=Niabella hibiscisoli TaxID=1825928 RepID=UPI001F0F6D28|nr:NAD(P)-dependent oxidoreductase [Niabella hibiscisoli]MCH5718172.1 NAD(P)-dependent oxidoreductase [Niabella hibiscisoli]